MCARGMVVMLGSATYLLSLPRKCQIRKSYRVEPDLWVSIDKVVRALAPSISEWLGNNTRALESR
jgi:hypothetical protein